MQWPVFVGRLKIAEFLCMHFFDNETKSDSLFIMRSDQSNTEVKTVIDNQAFFLQFWNHLLRVLLFVETVTETQRLCHASQDVIGMREKTLWIMTFPVPTHRTSREARCRNLL